jgi:hypothetical protein
MPTARKCNLQDMHETFPLEVTARGLENGRMKIFFLDVVITKAAILQSSLSITYSEWEIRLHIYRKQHQTCFTLNNKPYHKLH